MFDAVLLVSFGGPQGMDDIRPFLANVLRGRRVSPQRIEEVAKHYEYFDGISPITDLTMRQAEGLRERLLARGDDLPVFVGMRNWHPLLPDTLRKMSEAGIRRAVGFITAAQHSYSSCAQYKQNVADARVALQAAGRADVEVTYVESWFDHDLFIEANAGHVREALDRLPVELRATARLICTAHSVPTQMAVDSQYREQLHAGAALVARRAGMANWGLVYQSRSGRPGDSWLEPDVCDYLRAEHAAGLRAAVICPIGFVCDHVEVLWDLDVEAAEVCRGLGIAMTRAKAANANPHFLDLMAVMVRRTLARYDGRRPVPLAPAPRPA
jgi:ferrochelatase